jgi:alpha-tubulin suppressor-like RCC1 family protein
MQTQYSNIINIITVYNNQLININKTQTILTEENIMSLLFSKQVDTTNQDVIAFFLLPTFSKSEINSKRKFYDRNMDLKDSVQDRSVIDVDISVYNTQTVIKYLFLLDLLSELYASLIVKSDTSDTLTLKCRYYVEEDGMWTLYKGDNYFRVDIIYQYDKTSGMPHFRLSDVRDISSSNKQIVMQIVTEMYSQFADDIKKHLLYFKNQDIQTALKTEQKFYIQNIQSFYKYCRLKLVFMTLKCIDTRDAQYFIERQLSYCFLNLKNDVIMLNVDEKNRISRNSIINLKDELKIYNDDARKKKDVIARNAKRTKKTYNKDLMYVCLFLTFIFILTTILTLNLQLSDSAFNHIAVIIVIITLLVYLTMNYIIYVNNLETFIVADKIIKFPLEPATSNSYLYKINKTIGIGGSSELKVDNSYWKAFNHDPETFWESFLATYTNGVASTNPNTGSVYRSNYKGEYLKINLVEDVILKYYTISISADDDGFKKGPSSFRLYAAKHPTRVESFANMENFFSNPPTNRQAASQAARQAAALAARQAATQAARQAASRQATRPATTQAATQATRSAATQAATQATRPAATLATRPAATQAATLATTQSTRSATTQAATQSTRSASTQSANPWIDPNHSEWKLLHEVRNTKFRMNKQNVNKKRFDISYTNEFCMPLIVASRRFSIVFKNNNLYAFGINQYGQLANAGYLKQFYPKLMISRLFHDSKPIPNIIQVAAGAYHTLFLENTGMVYACGSNKFGQLSSGQLVADGKNTDKTPDPVEVITYNSKSTLRTRLENIIQVAAGNTHSLFLKFNKTVTGCGRNNNGQLGTGDKIDVPLAGRHTITTRDNVTLASIVQISSDLYSFKSLFLKNDGTVHTCGLENPDSPSVLNLKAVPIPLSDNPPFIKKIASASSSCLFLTSENEVMAYGANQYGQLSIGRESTFENNPLYVNAPKSKKLTDIVDIAMGMYHSLFLKNNGDVYAAGYNNFGQLGIGNNQNQNIAQKLNAPTNVVQIAAGENHSLFLKNNGEVYACGNNGDGQVGTGQDNQEPISYISECTICLSDANASIYNKHNPSNVKQDATTNFTSDATNNTVKRIFTNMYESHIYTDNIGKEYNYYMLIINKLIDDTTRVRINELELYGNYKDQSTYLNTEYDRLYREMILPLDNSIALQQRIVDASNLKLSEAITNENNINKEIEKLKNFIAISRSGLQYDTEYTVVGLQDELRDLDMNIASTRLAALTASNLAAERETDIAFKSSQIEEQDLNKRSLQQGIANFQFDISKFENYGSLISTLQNQYEAAKAVSDGILSTYDEERIRTDAAMVRSALRLGQAKISESSQKALLQQQVDLQTTNVHIQASLSMDILKRTTQMQNAIDETNEILASSNTLNMLQEEFERRKTVKMDAEKRVLIQRGITEGAELLAKAEETNAAEMKDFADELRQDLQKLVTQSYQNRNSVLGIESDIRQLKYQISNIESDKTAFIENVGSQARLLELKSELTKKSLDIEIAQLNSDLQKYVLQVDNDIAEYQKNIDGENGLAAQLSRDIETLKEQYTQRFIELQKYKYVPKSQSVDSSIINIQTKIMFNINNTAMIIANSIIVTGMQKEYEDLKKQKPELLLLETRSKNDLDINKRDDKLIIATNKMILNILLLSIIFIIVYTKYQTFIIIIMAIIIFSIIVYLYLTDVLKIVRTKTSNKYWNMT